MHRERVVEVVGRHKVHVAGSDRLEERKLRGRHVVRLYFYRDTDNTTNPTEINRIA